MTDVRTDQHHDHNKNDDKDNNKDGHNDDEDPILAVQNSEDILEKIGLFSCDTLQPAAACALGACCRGLRTVMWAHLVSLRSRHEEAASLAAAVDSSCEALRDARVLDWRGRSLEEAHARTLGTLLGSGALARVKVLDLLGGRLGDEGVRGLCEGLGCGAAPWLGSVGLGRNGIGPAGAKALAAALGRGALRRLRDLYLGHNQLEDEGLAALAAPLRQCPALAHVFLLNTKIGDAGVAALVGGLGKQELKALKTLDLEQNPISGVACASLAAALHSGALPSLANIELGGSNITASCEAAKAVSEAVVANQARAARARKVAEGEACSR